MRSNPLCLVDRAIVADDEQCHRAYRSVLRRRSGEQFQQRRTARRGSVCIILGWRMLGGPRRYAPLLLRARARVLCETPRASPRWRGIPKPTWLIKPERSDPGFKWVSYIPRRGRPQIWSRPGSGSWSRGKGEGIFLSSPKRSSSIPNDLATGSPKLADAHLRQNPAVIYLRRVVRFTIHIFRASFEFRRTRKTGLLYLKVSWLTSTSSLLINCEELSPLGFH